MGSFDSLNSSVAQSTRELCCC